MRSTHTYGQLILWLLFDAICGCQVVDEEPLPSFEQKMVVHGFVKPSNAMVVQVSRSINPGSDSLNNNLGQAIVNLIHNGKDESATFTGSVFEAELPIMASDVISIAVDHEAYETVHATIKIPDFVPIGHVEIIENQQKILDNYNFIPVKIAINDLDPSLNYFHFNFLSGGQRQWLYFINDQNYVQSTKIDWYFEDAVIENGSVQFYVEKEALEEEITIQLKHVDHHYYQYFTTKELYDAYKNNPLAEPVEVYSNMENGLGVFAGYNEDAWVIEAP